MIGNITIKIDSVDTLRKIEKLLTRIEDPRPLLTLVGREIQKETDKMFTGPRPDKSSVRGEPIWKPLLPDTIRKKKQSGKVRGEADRPLVETGKLRNNLRKDRAIKINKTNMTYGVTMRKKGFDYPGIHQMPNNKFTPQRRWLFLNKANLIQIMNITKAWIEFKRGSL